jgi:membrane-associated HD superfamily phosphohydrolase
MKKRSYRSGYGPQHVTAGLVVLVILMLVCSQLVPILLSSDASFAARLSLRKYKEGELCDEDVYATSSFEFIDEAKTKLAVETAKKSVLPVFSYSLNATLRSTRRMDQFISAWNTPESAPRPSWRCSVRRSF